MSKITHAQFSAQAAYLAKDASNWAADVLMLPEDYGKPMRDGALERFLAGMRERLNRIEEWAKEPSAPTTTD